MKKNIYNLLLAGVVCAGATSCNTQEFLSPDTASVGIITAEDAIYDKATAEGALLGLYQQFRPLAPQQVIAGDMMADNTRFLGTSTQYGELGNHDLSAGNGSASNLWSNLYYTVYHANYLLDVLPTLSDLTTDELAEMEAAAKYFRGMAYFIGAETFGRIPLVLTLDVETNKNIARSELADVYAQVESDLMAAHSGLPTFANVGDSKLLSQDAAKAALARFYLYQENYANAKSYSEELINSGNYSLAGAIASINDGNSSEAIFEMEYTTVDNPGTSFQSVHNIFDSRREMTPSDEIVLASQVEAAVVGNRFSSKAAYNSANDAGTADNGYSVTYYDFNDWDNMVMFRLGEMHLISAEANANLNNFADAAASIDLLRNRAGASSYTNPNSAAGLLTDIETERRWELCYEGHRWYDLKRTNRASDVLSSLTGWDANQDMLYPIPEYEITNNPGLAGDQNPGY